MCIRHWTINLYYVANVFQPLIFHSIKSAFKFFYCAHLTSLFLFLELSSHGNSTKNPKAGFNLNVIDENETKV